jgi:nucleotide-binding universal stress UspA family protein
VSASQDTVTQATAANPETFFSGIVAGVDGSEAGLEAARQAGRLVAPDGWLEVVTVVYLAEANLAGWSAARVRAELEQEGGEAARKGAEIAGPLATLRLVNGPPLRSLVRELEDRHATLAIVGTHGHSRLSEIVIGGVAGPLLHDSPCSVCIARPPAVEALFPRSIVAGVDGSSQSELVAGVGRYLAGRFGAELSLVTAVGGEDDDQPDLKRAYGLGAVVVGGHPVEALVEASTNADLLVVGSRGLHGFKALGSVSERVAHQAQCSVLVVRGSD